MKARTKKQAPKELGPALPQEVEVVIEEPQPLAVGMLIEHKRTRRPGVILGVRITGTVLDAVTWRYTGSAPGTRGSRSGRTSAACETFPKHFLDLFDMRARCTGSLRKAKTRDIPAMATPRERMEAFERPMTKCEVCGSLVRITGHGRATSHMVAMQGKAST